VSIYDLNGLKLIRKLELFKNVDNAFIQSKYYNRKRKSYFYKFWLVIIKLFNMLQIHLLTMLIF